MNQYRRVYAKVDLDAILYNMNHMHENINEGTKMIAVIKTNGYGHGACEIAKTLEVLPYVWGYAVATAEEAIELREHDLTKPILILGYTFKESYEALIKNEVRPAVYTYEMAKEMSDEAIRQNKEFRIHIKLDTGMSRIGFLPKEESVKEIVKISKLPNIKIEGIFTHFARADEIDKTYTNIQYDRFCEMIEKCEQAGVQFPLKHCSNSASILEYKKGNMDLVRAGITLYGLWPSEEVDHSFPLKPVLSLYSHVVNVKTLPKDVAISYGGTYVTDKEKRIATIPVGYGDGYPRGLSNKGYVLIHGKFAPIVGRVCMDQMMVDVTDIPSVEIGDLVTLIGKDADKNITMEELGELSGRFNYEFACDLGNRIPRLYYKDNKLIHVWDYFKM